MGMVLPKKGQKLFFRGGKTFLLFLHIKHRYTCNTTDILYDFSITIYVVGKGSLGE